MDKEQETHYWYLRGEISGQLKGLSGTLRRVDAQKDPQTRLALALVDVAALCLDWPKYDPAFIEKKLEELWEDQEREDD